MAQAPKNVRLVTMLAPDLNNLISSLSTLSPVEARERSCDFSMPNLTEAQKQHLRQVLLRHPTVGCPAAPPTPRKTVEELAEMDPADVERLAARMHQKNGRAMKEERENLISLARLKADLDNMRGAYTDFLPQKIAKLEREVAEKSQKLVQDIVYYLEISRQHGQNNLLADTLEIDGKHLLVGASLFDPLDY
jgi:hypothetical protein